MMKHGSSPCPMPNHIMHTRVRLGEEGFMDVVFADDSEIDYLIRLLTHLRDNPEEQNLHVHIQDYRMCNAHPEQARPDDGEVVFHSPRRKPGECPWIDEDIEGVPFLSGGEWRNGHDHGSDSVSGDQRTLAVSVPCHQPCTGALRDKGGPYCCRTS